jgi:hypothetical protein
MKNKTLVLFILFSTPILFFIGNRLLQMFFPPEIPESLKNEIISAVMCGYGASIGLWFLFRKAYKNQKKKSLDKE